jgi:hypothetical protein
MKSISLKTLSLAILASIAASAAIAAPVTLTGNCVKMGANDLGTLGSGGSTPPGILYDATCTGTFVANTDYLTPGTPFEGFGVRSTQSGFAANSNESGAQIAATGALTTNTVAGFTNSVTWAGALAGFYNVVNSYFFNANDERINVRTTITALTDLTNLSFSRAIDPDPDALSSGVFNTNNQRGFGTLAATDFVYSAGGATGRPLGLYSNSAYVHNTAIVSNWPELDPTVYLSGLNDGNGDYAIGMGWLIGSLTKGQSATIDYAYVMGTSVGTIDIPPTGVPVGAPLVLLAFGLAQLGFARRRAAK